MLAIALVLVAVLVPGSLALTGATAVQKSTQRSVATVATQRPVSVVGKDVSMIAADQGEVDSDVMSAILKLFFSKQQKNSTSSRYTKHAPERRSLAENRSLETDWSLVDAELKRFGVPGRFNQWQSWSELIVTPDNRFLYCAIPKSGCTSWKQLMLRVSGLPDWNTTDSTRIHNPRRSKLHFVGLISGKNNRDLNATNVSDIANVFFNSAKIKKAVIVRDPVTRILSTYLDRCVDFGEWFRCLSNTPISFDGLVGKLMSVVDQGLELEDVHFRPQLDMCGLRFMDYDFVGHMEHFTSDSRTILEATGLWDHYGASGWSSSGRVPFGTEVQQTSNHVQLHETDDLVCQHYTPTALDWIHQIYKEDFDAFGYNVDVWHRKCDSVWSQGGGNRRLVAGLEARVTPRRLMSVGESSDTFDDGQPIPKIV
eukprot:TRINITY_DN50423_c0_g1_i1.p1 TRINITY_DN50423_c0_g1~~TRINITY_DN50423_c0_g1_i1.p1  ORF type:complete len:425 (-),score=63.69 TRINITY_DN50423_c0_g1_i1:307-1581(-)